MPKDYIEYISENNGFTGILNEEYKVQEFFPNLIYFGLNSGDEALNPLLNNRIYGADYVTHEAFCLDREENIFHAYEKNHSTALSAAKTMNELNVKNLILYHTEESHGIDRKSLYLEEVQSVFKGNIIVPNDLDVIQLVKKK